MRRQLAVNTNTPMLTQHVCALPICALLLLLLLLLLRPH
jgi:hypothetical protein